MKSNIFINENVLFSAFRYALGRQTYVVSEVTEALEENAFVLTDKLRHQIMGEIQGYFRANIKFDNQDLVSWKHCLRVLEEVDEYDDDDDDEDF